MFYYNKIANGFTGWFSRFNDCLASQGVAAWVITSISIDCRFTCGSPVPAVRHV